MDDCSIQRDMQIRTAQSHACNPSPSRLQHARGGPLVYAGRAMGRCYVVRARILPAMSAACRKFLACLLDVAVQTLILPAMFEGETHHLWPTLLLDTNAVSQWVDVRLCNGSRTVNLL